MFAASALINHNKSSWDEFPNLRLTGHRVHTAITKQMKKIPGFAQSFRLIHSPLPVTMSPLPQGHLINELTHTPYAFTLVINGSSRRRCAVLHALISEISGQVPSH